jgi:hypothetical protein
MPRVTENLRRQWANARSQMVEERTEDQSGRPRSPEDVALVDFDMAVMDALLALPLGTKFDAREVDAQVRATFDFTAPAVPVAATVVASDVSPAGETEVTYDVEFRESKRDPWFAKVPGFETPEDAWDHLDMLAAKPIYKGCFWQVVETRRAAVGDPR